jgi:twinkle protein
MTGICVEKLPHSCGSSDGLQVFKDEGGFSGYCFSCETYLPDPYEGKGKRRGPIRKPKEEEVQAELQDISEGLGTFDLPSRKLREPSLEHFSVKVGLSEVDGSTPTISFFPYYSSRGNIVAYKAKLLSQKTMWSVGNIKDAKMFGWPQALSSGSPTLFITEGEEDAIALYQALKDNSKNTKWSELEPAVISLKFGAGSVTKNLTDHLPEIKKNFKEVVLVFDQDDQGREAVRKAMDVLPTAKVCATLPEKDANACVIKGRNKALVNAVLFKAEVPNNTRLVNAVDLYEAARTPALPGLSWPWKGLTDLTRGMRFGETYYLGAGVKMGKSELVNTLASHIIIEHNMPVLLAKPEESNVKTVKMVYGKVVGKFFHDPNIPFDYDAFDVAHKKIDERLFMIDVYQHLGWQSLRNEILIAHQKECRAIFIDPISNLTNGINSGEANTILQEIAQELSAIAKDLNLIIFIFCHLKAPTVGDPHERGGKVLSHQFSGSRAMMRSCNMMIGLEGSKDPDLEIEERNMRKLIILEDREFGASGFVNLYWDHKTGLFNEVQL